MKKFISIIFTAIIVDCFFFSTSFSFLGPLNTKMVLAAIGLGLFVLDLIKKKDSIISNELFVLTILAAGVSVMSFATMTINHTNDSVYLDYLMSMWVWLASAYAVVRFIKWSHGYISVRLISHYLIAVALFQCSVALAVAISPNFAKTVTSLIPELKWAASVDRLYGFASTASLDTGGVRFAIALILNSRLIHDSVQDDENRVLIPLYLLSFMFICVMGNMIARTTSVGVIIGLLYLLLNSGIWKFKVKATEPRIWCWLLISITIIAGISTQLYNTNTNVRNYLRFAFEGFFNLFETGKWQIDSTDKLKTMYVYPDNAHTWIIGDGYMENPEGDANYIGKITEGYYKGTDVGYLRFLFYFGFIGLLVFSVFILVAGKFCRDSLDDDNKVIATLLLILHFTIWFKVATDCFFIIALFMCVGLLEEDYDEQDDEQLIEV